MKSKTNQNRISKISWVVNASLILTIFPTLMNAQSYISQVQTDGAVYEIAQVTNNGETVNQSSSLEPSAAISVEAWVMAGSNVSNYPAFVSYGSDYGPHYETYILQASSIDGNSSADFFFNTVHGLHQVFGKTKLQSGKLYYLAATYDGQTAKIYVNGNLDGSLSLSSNIAGNVGPYDEQNGLGLGGKFSTPSNDFSGQLSNVAIYNQALSASQISNHYVLGSSGSSSSSSSVAASVPNAPSGLKGSSSNTSSIQLSWTDNSNNETAFLLERKTTKGGDPYVQVQSLAAGKSSYLDTPLTANWEYTYRLRATNAVGNSGYSNEVTVQVLNTSVSSSSSSSSSASASSSSSSASSSSSSSVSGGPAGAGVSPLNPSCSRSVSPTGGNDNSSLQNAIDSTASNQTLCLGSGTFNISTILSIHTGQTIAGKIDGSSHLNISLASAGYGLKIDGNASNVTIENIDFVSNHGVISWTDGSSYTNLHLLYNRFQFAGGASSNGTLVFGLYGSVGGSGFEVEYNYFHDSLSSVRNYEIWGAKNSNFDHNTSYNVVDGGHMMEPQGNVSVSYNYMTHLHRMGQEIQGSTATSGLMVQGNVYYDWVSPYYDSFGLSVVNHNSIGTTVQNNYIRMNIASGSSWGQTDGSINRFGYGIEMGGQSSQVLNNTVAMVNTAAAGVDASTVTIAKGNKMYGTALWGIFGVEPGPSGDGSYSNNINTDNTFVSNANSVPTPPANSNGYLQ